MGLVAVEDKPGRQGAPEFAQARERLGSALIAAHFEGTVTSDPNFDLIAFFEVERIDDGRGQPHRQTVTPS
jgi:hypothetical protein